MEEQATIPDMQLLARLVLVREEAHPGLCSVVAFYSNAMTDPSFGICHSLRWVQDQHIELF
jgi:hypothetical protein